ncbi:hypothetical protein N7508_005245 [Penicillium antarcticum]|uniref:uncharacterized protein n=1 Tax=Penicillium antarcticum TaxID=416450 RepID=UPI0023904803|nr:uncharacterized protein N7508_005245 [Penicillium antarcticum]KAJ5306230.1 hypothetical protein N7508_005245 [Penicillium antarcticum]
MPQIRAKSKAEDLARVRNNQRNCRARRKEYVHDLEQKVKFYETTQNAQVDELHKRMELLAVENQLLKYFVESVTSTMDPTFEQPFAPLREDHRAMTGSELDLDLLVSSGYPMSSTSMPDVSSTFPCLTLDNNSNCAQTISIPGGTKPIHAKGSTPREENAITSDTYLPELPPPDDQFLYMSSQLPENVVHVLQSPNFSQMEFMPHNVLAQDGSLPSNSGYAAMNCNPGSSNLLSEHTISCSEACKLLDPVEISD